MSESIHKEEIVVNGLLHTFHTVVSMGRQKIEDRERRIAVPIYLKVVEVVE